MNLVNLTDRIVKIIDANNSVITTIMPVEEAQVTVRAVPGGGSMIDDNKIPLRRIMLETNIPGPEPETLYIVDRYIATIFHERDDLVVPVMAEYGPAPDKLLRRPLLGYRALAKF